MSQNLNRLCMAIAAGTVTRNLSGESKCNGELI
nr:MAG TPA: hypothetical protein [Caudoviricetes sp.]